MRIIESLELFHHESIAMGTLANTGIKPYNSAQNRYVYISDVVKETLPFNNQRPTESFIRRGWFYAARILFLPPNARVLFLTEPLFDPLCSEPYATDFFCV